MYTEVQGTRRPETCRTELLAKPPSDSFGRGRYKKTYGPCVTSLRDTTRDAAGVLSVCCVTV
jgi:hypothetical protein